MKNLADSNLVGRFARRRGAIAVPITRCAWIHRRSVRCTRWHDRCASNILRCRHPLSAVQTEIAELLRLSAEVHCLDPASRLAIGVSATVADLRDLVES